MIKDVQFHEYLNKILLQKIRKYKFNNKFILIYQHTAPKPHPPSAQHDCVSHGGLVHGG